MTLEAYIALLTQIYRQANLSDTEDKEDWQKVTDSMIHSQAIETIVKDLLTPEEFQLWLDNL